MFAHQSPQDKPPNRLTAPFPGNLREILGILLCALALWLCLALFSYHPKDPGWSYVAGDADRVHNAAGTVGARLADVILYFLGAPGYLLPALFLVSAVRLLYRRRHAPLPVQLAVRTLGTVLLLVGATTLSWLHIGAELPLPRGVQGAGGIVGDVIGGWSWTWAGEIGSTLFALALFLTGVSLYTQLSWLRLMDRIGRLALGLSAWYQARLQQRRSEWEDEIEGARIKQERDEMLRQQQEQEPAREPPKIKPLPEPVTPGRRVDEERQHLLFEAPASQPPPLHLLDRPEAGAPCYTPESLEALSRMLELKLQDFGVVAKVAEVHPGPVITRFELEPAAGVKVSKISNLAKDLARALSVSSVRIVEVIPGKSLIGLEIPNEKREQVVLSEILGSQEYEALNSPLAIGLGKDIGGHTVVADLEKMPHLLVAGTTGSGKSVALNAMILSLLYKSPPETVRLILIDPKMLELSVYGGIAHLLTPVVTDMKEAANALRWSVTEMERRYRLMAALGVRNLASFNRKVQRAGEQGEPLPDPLAGAQTADDNDQGNQPVLSTLPHIVIIVDELADMMMTVGKKVEELIARLAQKARAAGIHLVLATQRPSVDVITGLIKANIPCRIAFQVSSRVDSRTILDQSGAESLLGHGDMLYLSPGTGIPMRVHGAFVSDNEVHNVVGHITASAAPDYLDEVLGEQTGDGSDADPLTVNGSEDPLYDEAVRIVSESRKSSISYIQRRLKVGYNRSARLVEEMEKNGILGPMAANGSREVLIAAPQTPGD